VPAVDGIEVLMNRPLCVSAWGHSILRDGVVDYFFEPAAK
jgi:hypothetical protein